MLICFLKIVAIQDILEFGRSVSFVLIEWLKWMLDSS